jgi:exopolyphosphatase/guanosine-5'-triphosphate,3'-diphosphate pyrophosphatase
LVANSDLAGFSDGERLVIANLARYHRKSMPQQTHPEFQALDPESRRAVVLLAPLLRIAVALDQSQDQRVENVNVDALDKGVELTLESHLDVDVERWHAEQVAPIFRETYGLPLVVRIKR